MTFRRIARWLGSALIVFLQFPASYAAEIDRLPSDFLDNARNILTTKLDERETKVAKEIHFIVEDRPEGVKKIRSFIDPDSGKSFVEFDKQAYFTLWELASAYHFGLKIGGGLGEQYVLGYARYLPLFRAFSKVLQAKEYAQTFGIADNGNDISVADEEILQTIHLSIVMFMVAHEVAHHVNGDVNSGGGMPEDERRREEAADAWAIKKLIELRLEPRIAAFGLILLSEYERHTPAAERLSDHPFPLRRIVSVIEASKAAIKDPKGTARAALGLTDARALEDYIGQLEKSSNGFQAMLDEQIKLETDPEYLMSRAKQGSVRARLRLSQAYWRGDYKGFPVDRPKSAVWSMLVAAQNPRFDYFATAYAAYTAGFLTTPTNEKLGCEFLIQADKLNLIVGSYELRFVRENQGKCN